MDPKVITISEAQPESMIGPTPTLARSKVKQRENLGAEPRVALREGSVFLIHHLCSF